MVAIGNSNGSRVAIAIVDWRLATGDWRLATDDGRRTT